MRRGLRPYMLCVFLLCLGAIGNASALEKDPFGGLVAYLKRDYHALPLRVVGRVKEVSAQRLLFEKKDSSVAIGQRLGIFEHQEGLSPSLQRQVAWIEVEALFTGTAVARIETIDGQGTIKKDDWVLTPPSPVIYLYTNLERKQAVASYRKLLQDLLALNFHIREVRGDHVGGRPHPADLLLRLESEEGRFSCRLSSADETRIFYSESLPANRDFRTAFQADHSITWGPPGSDIKTGPEAVTQRKGPTFNKSGASADEGAEYYRLSEAYSRLVSCDLEGDGTPELVLMNEKGLSVFHFREGKLLEQFRYRFSARDMIPLHLHSMDLDGNGGDELIVTAAEPVVTLDKKDNRLASLILTFTNHKFQPLADDWPWYLRVIQNRAGERVALAQEEGEYEQYAGPIYRVEWNRDTKSAKIGSPFKPASGIHSLYQFTLVAENPDRVIILEPNAAVHGYFTPREKIEAFGERQYGSYEEIAYPIKLEKDQNIGGFDKKTYREVFAPRRFELRTGFDNQSFLIYKERPGNRGLVHNIITGSAQGLTDRVAAVRWGEKDRITETWQSKKMSKDLLDFTFLENPDRLLVLYRDGDGCGLEAIN